MTYEWTRSKIKVPESHKIGWRAVQILGYKLPKSWPPPQPSGHDTDYGIDLRIEVVKNSYHTGTDFNVQIKGTKTIPKSAERRRIHLRRSTVSYLLNKVSPTMLALCDVRTERVYYTWLQSAVDALTTKSSESTISFEIDFSGEISNDFEQRATRFLSLTIGLYSWV